MKDYHTFWDKSPADLENNIEYNEQVPYNHINYPKTVTKNWDEVIPLENNMPQIVDRSLLNQGVATKNKKLVAIISLYNLSYSCNKRTNLF